MKLYIRNLILDWMFRLIYCIYWSGMLDCKDASLCFCGFWSTKQLWSWGTSWGISWAGIFLTATHLILCVVYDNFQGNIVGLVYYITIAINFFFLSKFDMINVLLTWSDTCCFSSLGFASSWWWCWCSSSLSGICLNLFYVVFCVVLHLKYCWHLPPLSFCSIEYA